MTKSSAFPYMDLLGFELVETDDGSLAFGVELGPQHMNPNGIAHGAVTYALIDTAMGGATMTVAEEGQRCATNEIQIRYHRGPRSGRIIATASVISKGRRIAHLDAKAVDGDGELIATATGSFSITGEPAEST